MINIIHHCFVPELYIYYFLVRLILHFNLEYNFQNYIQNVVLNVTF